MLARVSLTTDAGPAQSASARPRQAPGPAGGWRGWIGPLSMGVVAAALRLPGLDRPHALVFDETYYAKDGLALLLFGHERNAKDNANDLLLAMDGNNLEAAGSIFKDSPSYVVHPPFGKWVIAAGQWAFGANPFGWRIAVAVLGILSVVLLARIVRRMTGSNLLGSIAGFLLAIDGMGIVMSRTALLDGILAFMVLLAFGALLLDRDRTRRLWPKRSLRPWRVAAAVALGLACGVKWSGLWFVVAFGLLTVFWDLGLRRQHGQSHVWLKTLLRDAIPAALVMLPIVFVTYVATWYGWFTSSGYLRTWAFDNGGYTGIQGALRSLAHYHSEAYNFHTGLTTEHSYQSSAWGWPVLARPTSFFYESDGLQCGADKCSQEVIALGNPIIWWAAALALFHQVWRWVAVRDWRAGAVLCGFVAGWGPWLLFQERTVFSFYSIVFLPFMIMALTLSFGSLLGSPSDTRERRGNGAIVVVAFLFAAVVTSWWFYPIWTAQIITYEQWQMRMWLPTWV